MARHTYFAFHYQRDVQRAAIVRNSWVHKSDRVDAGFFEDGLWEKAKHPGGSGIKQLIGRGMSGTSVTCVCVGLETWARHWVRYELLKSFVDGKGIFAVRIHNIPNFDRETDEEGSNPFDYLAFKTEEKGVRLKVKFQGKWDWSKEFPDVIPWATVPYDLGDRDHHTFSTLFHVRDWNDDGYTNLGKWIEAAAQQASR